jgi:hypothetical protein
MFDTTSSRNFFAEHILSLIEGLPKLVKNPKIPLSSPFDKGGKRGI